MRSDEIRPGDLVAGKYRVRAILSRSRGMLVEAFHTEFDQRVVIRILSPAICDAKEIERFRREARTLAKLESEHVARIFDVGTEADGTFYFVRQYLEGQDLGSYLKKRGRLPLHEAVLYVLQAAEAMAETHSHQIILREMQPQHLFLTQRLGTSLIKVVDFGTAKLLRDAAPPGAGGELTATTMFGLSPYSSPELVRKAKNVDVRTDIWSLGAILYELLAGKPPFQGEMAALMLSITKDEPIPMSQQRPDLPREMDQVIGWCLAKDVDRRFVSVHAFAHALLPYAPPEGQVLVSRIGAMANAAKERRPASVPPPPGPPAPGAAVTRAQTPAAKQGGPRPAAGRPAQPLDDVESVTQLHGVDLLDDDDEEDERIKTKVMTSPAEAPPVGKQPPAKPGPAAGGRPVPPAPAGRPGSQPPPRPPQPGPSVRPPPPAPPPPAAAAGGGGEAPFERTVFIGNDFVPPSASPAKQPGANRPPAGPTFAGAAQGVDVSKAGGPPGAAPPNARPGSMPGIAMPPGAPPPGAAPPGVSPPGAAPPNARPGSMPGIATSPAAPGAVPGVLGPSPQIEAPRPAWGPAPADGNRQPTPMASVLPGASPSFGPQPPASSSSAAGTGQHAALGAPKNAGARKAAIAAIAAACVLLPALALLFIFGGKTDGSGSAATEATGAVSVPAPSSDPAPTVAPTATEAPSTAPVASNDVPPAVTSTAGNPPPATSTTTAPPASSPTGKSTASSASTATSKPTASATTAPPTTSTATSAPAGGGDMGTIMAVAVGGTCQFSVNGASKGSGSSVKISVKAGTYSVSCKPPTGATKTRSVSVTSGGTQMAMFKLQ